VSSKPDRHDIVKYPLASFGGEAPLTAPWLSRLELSEPESHNVMVKGANVEYCTWGEANRPGVLLVHGLFAHSRWWGPVAPLLAHNFRVASLSLSGMGRSGWRTEYSFDMHAEEMLAVMDDAGLLAGDAMPALIAHSFGANSASILAAGHGDKLSCMIMVDTGMASGKHPSSSTKLRRYKTLKDALGRFRLSPPQNCENAWLVDEVGRHGLLKDADGFWRWCFDPDYVSKLRYSNSFEALHQSRCPLAFVYGEQSELTPERIREAQQAQAPAGTTFTMIPDAAHHVMLDQPVRLAETLRTLLTRPERECGIPSSAL